MNPGLLSSSRRERLQMVMIAIAPALAVVLLAVAGAVTVGQDALLFGVFAIPLAYGTLFLSVLPALTLLRRFRSETLASFTLTVSAATLAPWAVLVCVYSLVASPQDQPPASLVTALLVAPTLAAALVAIPVWLLGFRCQHAA